MKVKLIGHISCIMYNIQLTAVQKMHWRIIRHINIPLVGTCTTCINCKRVDMRDVLADIVCEYFGIVTGITTAGICPAFIGCKSLVHSFYMRVDNKVVSVNHDENSWAHNSY